MHLFVDVALANYVRTYVCNTVRMSEASPNDSHPHSLTLTLTHTLISTNVSRSSTCIRTYVQSPTPPTSASCWRWRSPPLSPSPHQVWTASPEETSLWERLPRARERWDSSAHPFCQPRTRGQEGREGRSQTHTNAERWNECVYVYMHACVCVRACVCVHTYSQTRRRLHWSQGELQLTDSTQVCREHDSEWTEPKG